EAALAADQIRWQLHGAIESFSEGLALFDADDRLLFCNNRYREFYTQVADSIRPGIGFEDLVRLKVASSLFAESDRSADELISLYLGLHKNPRHSMEVRLRSGRWLRVTDRRTKDGGIVCVRTDITELKRRESSLTKLSNELRTQILRFDTALNNMIQGLCLFDSEQRLIVCNQRYLEMYRFSPEIVKPGITLREIMEYSVSIGNYSAEDAQRAIAERPMHAAKRRQATLLQRLKDGRVMAVMHQPMADGSSVATYEDVTQRVRAEDGLRAYATKLEQSNRELQHFASIASHDLQEPLRKIEAFGDRLQAKYADALDDNGKMYISRMQIAANRMRTLINDLLMYSRVTTKAKPFVATDLNQIAQDVVSDLQITIERANGRVEIDALPTIDSDATQMRQLLQNLISNALKFRHEGVAPVVRITGSVVVPPDPIPDPCGGPSGECEICVADNGIGFEVKYLDRIFGIFQRLHGRNEYEGTGIGLATCRKLVER
ncbi:MAG: PAS-domain containing protein, partial [Nitrospirota bacterium]|nr:PAS-domain containing protein [Nitrospirota bacterium]